MGRWLARLPHSLDFPLLSGSQCHAAAAAAARATCSFPCCPGNPPLELSAVCAAHWPHGEEAGGSGLNGTDAGNVQLHAGEDLPPGTHVFCRLKCDAHHASVLRTPCWSLTDSPLTPQLSQRSLWNPLPTWIYRWCVPQVGRRFAQKMMLEIAFQFH